MTTPLHFNLKKCLHKTKKLWLNWQAPLKITKGVTKGLAYLHNKALGGCLVHCDIKGRNIFYKTFKVHSRFWTAKLMQQDEFEVDTSKWAGTLSFGDLHYREHFICLVKVDVYYFRVLFFILVSGVKDMVWLVKKMKKKDIMNIDFTLQEDDTYNFVELHY